MRAALLAAIAIAVAACGTSTSRADDTKLCTDVAADVAGNGFAATPSPDQARTLGVRLDARVHQLATPGLHDVVVRLHGHVHEIETGWRHGGAAVAARAADRARRDLEQLASHCGTPGKSPVS